jgi:hypothetical protein
MDIEKLGKVEIIRLKDKKFKPERKKKGEIKCY